MTFSATQIRLNAVDLIAQATDPRTGGGVAAAIGSMVLKTTAFGGVFQKTPKRHVRLHTALVVEQA